MATTITTLAGVTLITLQSSPANSDFISEVFERIAKEKINVDMISMSPTRSSLTELSFTISDDDLIKTLKFTKDLKTDLAIKSIVSSVNHKISIYDKEMKNASGFASKVFSAIKSSDADIRLITTSEVEISLLVSEADFDKVFDNITKTFSS